MAHDWTERPADTDLRSENRHRSVPDPDRLYRLLADGERRTLLAVLLERDEPLPLTDLRTRLADDGDERKVGIRLVHAHLPKLDEAGLVEYDREAERAAATAVAAEVAAAF